MAGQTRMPPGILRRFQARGGVSRNMPTMALIDIDGVRLEVQHLPASPAGAGLAPLVFLHEGLGSVAAWRDWPTRLCAATGRAGWVYSRRGYGQSDAVPDVRGPSRLQDGLRVGRLLPDYMHREALDVLPALLARLGVQRPVLVGHSDGGSIALLHASRFPVTACLVMAPHVIVEDISIQAIAAVRTAYEAGHGPGGLRERLARYHADVDCAFWQWNDVWLSEAFRSFDIRSDCGRISAPLLAIQGLDDPYGTLLQIESLAGEPHGSNHNPPDKSAVFPLWNGLRQLQKLEQCGHSPHRDQSALTTGLMARFLAQMAVHH